MPEDFRERRIADAQAAGIGAERRHHGALAVAGKTAPLHRAAAGRDARLGMQMAGDFARRAGRLVAERDRPDRDFARDHAAEIGRQRRIVIARNPDPVAPRLHRRERVAVGRGQPLMRVAVVKAVAERDHHARIVPRDDGGKPAQRRHGIVGRQQHAARGKAGAFFQMQVGDDEQALLLPEQRAGEIGERRSRRRS